jgi:hypothetical protein
MFTHKNIYIGSGGRGEKSKQQRSSNRFAVSVPKILPLGCAIKRMKQDNSYFFYDDDDDDGWT